MRYPAIILLLVFFGMAACSTIPITPQITATDNLVKDKKIWTASHTITPTEKKKIRKVLIADSKAMKQQQIEISVEKEKAKDNAAMAKVGRWAIISAIVSAGLILLALVLKILSWFKIIP